MLAAEFHGSVYCLPVGTVLRPGTRPLYRGNTERWLEEFRPASAVSRSNAVFATRTRRGVLKAGAGNIYIYEVEPLGRVSGPYDGGWITYLLGLGYRLTASELLAAATAYWAGRSCRSKFCYGAKEYLLEGGARIVRTIKPTDPEAATCTGPIHSGMLPEGGIVKENPMLLEDFDPLRWNAHGPPSYGHEYFRYQDNYWNVGKAKWILATTPARRDVAVRVEKWKPIAETLAIKWDRIREDLKYDDPEEQIIDLDIPVILVRWDNKVFPIDGWHRIGKALLAGIPVLSGIVLSTSESRQVKME